MSDPNKYFNGKIDIGRISTVSVVIWYQFKAKGSNVKVVIMNAMKIVFDNNERMLHWYDIKNLCALSRADSIIFIQKEKLKNNVSNRNSFFISTIDPAIWNESTAKSVILHKFHKRVVVNKRRFLCSNNLYLYSMFRK